MKNGELEYISKKKWDVIVIGSGPAGSVAAHYLADAGLQTLVLDKDNFPRFHIGESSTPYMAKILEEMEILEDVLALDTSVKKNGIEMALDPQSYVRAPFSNMHPQHLNHAVNISRAKFDYLLVQSSKSKGAYSVMGANVKDIEFVDGKAQSITVVLDGEKVKLKADYFIDASGRSGLIARKLNTRIMDSRLKNFAIYQHYYEIDREKVDVEDWGDLCVQSFDKGWVWGIPVAEDKFSIGVVVRASELNNNSVEELFRQGVESASRVRLRTQGGKERFENLQTESDFCYHNNNLAGEGYFLVGDAGCFIDPAFSGGVFLAMTSGREAAKAILRINEGADPSEAQSHYMNVVKSMYDSYFRIILRFYSHCQASFPALFKDFDGHFDYVQQVLCGDFCADPDNPFMKVLWNDPDLQTFEEPFTRIHTCPIYGNKRYTSEDTPEVPYQISIVKTGTAM